MKKNWARGKSLLICCMSLFLLISCAQAPNVPQHMSPSFAEKSLTTLGVLPVTYDVKYEEPLEVKLSQAILRNAEKALQTRGYQTLILNKAPKASGKGQSGPITMEPSQVVQDIPADVDGVVVIHITSHFGVDITQRQPEAMGPSISLHGLTRLISVKNPEELWRDKGTGKSFPTGRFLRRTQFQMRLNEATRSLADSLFATLPAKTD